MVIPNPQNDQVIANNLGGAFAFGHNGIDKLRRHYAIERFFDGNHTLERVAYRISALPSAAVQPRWYGLLSQIDTVPALNNTRNTIKGQLHAALINNTVHHLEFTAVLDHTVAYHTVAITPIAGVANAFLLTLHCPTDPYNGPVKQAGPPDANEQHPTIIWP